MMQMVWICLVFAWICLGGGDADDIDDMDDGDDAVELRYASNEAKVVGWFGFVPSLLGLGL